MIHCDKLASKKYTWSEERKGFIDQSYEFVKSLNFSPNLSNKHKNFIKRKSRPTSPKKLTPITVRLQALILRRILIPSHFNAQPLSFIPPRMVANHWGAQVGPLSLGANLHPLPKGAREVLPKFYGDGKKSTDEHLNAFNIAWEILAVTHEDVSVRLFVQTLIEDAANWFHHLPQGSITD